MSGRTLASALALAAGIGLTWVAVIGLLRSKDAFDRLHFPGLASICGPLALAVSMVFAGVDGTSTLRAWLIAAILIPTGGVLSHAIARAEWLRRESRSESNSDREGANREMA